MPNNIKGFIVSLITFLCAASVAPSQVSLQTTESVGRALGCGGVERVAVNQVTEIWNDGEETQCFLVTVDAPGILVLEAVAPGWQTQPKLGLPSQQGFTAASLLNHRIVKHYVGGAITEVERAGDYLFRVASQDPASALESYRLYAGFTRAAPRRDQECLGSYHQVVHVPVPATGTTSTPPDETEEDSDVDPNVNPYRFRAVDAGWDPSRCAPSMSSALPPTTGTGTASTPPDETEEDSDVDPNVNPYRFAGSDPSSGPLYCDDLVDDDQADNFFCAAPLAAGSELIGQLHQDQAIDIDTVTFTLTEQSRVHLAILSDGDLLSELYDANGHRLHWSDSRGVQWDLTLNPGRYYVRLSGWTLNEASYGIALETASW